MSLTGVPGCGDIARGPRGLHLLIEVPHKVSKQASSSPGSQCASRGTAFIWLPLAALWRVDLGWVDWSRENVSERELGRKNVGIRQDTAALSNAWFSYISSHSVVCLFIFMVVFFDVLKFFILMKSNHLHFSFVALPLVWYPGIHYQVQGQEIFPYVLFLRVFKFWIFNPYVSNFIVVCVGIPFFRTVCCRGCPCSMGGSWQPWWGWLRCEGLFLCS